MHKYKASISHLCVCYLNKRVLLRKFECLPIFDIINSVVHTKKNVITISYYESK